MVRMVVQASALTNDKVKFDTWKAELGEGITTLLTALQPYDGEQIFGSPVDGIAKFRDTFKNALAALEQYVRGASNSGTSACEAFSDALQRASDVYDETRRSVRELVPAE